MKNIKSNLKLIELIYPLTLILVTLSTFIIRFFGPAPFINENNSWVIDPNLALEEPRDLYILFSWWLISLFIVYLLWKVSLRNTNKIILIVGGFSIQLISIYLIFLSASWALDSHNASFESALWTGIEPKLILYSSFILLIVFYFFLNRMEILNKFLN